MTKSPLITTQELAKILSQPDVLVFDCRFNLTDPAWGRQNYLEGHIPGAFYVDLNHDLASPATPQTGRHPLPDPVRFVEEMARWGITPQTRVVVYDTVGGGYAGRLWWMLIAIGHLKVQLLDGGYAKWKTKNRPDRAGEEVPVPTSFLFPPNFNPEMFITAGEIQAAQIDSTQILIDARAPERFQGVQELIDPVAGHIPGAHNRFHGMNLTTGGVFKSPDQLRQEFEMILGAHSAANTIVYCGSGVTSCHHLIALQLAGLPGARLYVGSWSDWIRDPAHPIATGE